MYRSFREESFEPDVMLEALRSDGQVNVGFVDEGDTVRVVASEGKFWELLNAATKLENDRQGRYKDYDTMEEDPVISGTLEMVVDDCTQYSKEMNATIWVEGEYEYKKDIEEFLSDIDFENRVWGWTYNIAKYGDFMPKLEFFGEDEEDGGVKAVREDTHPGCVYRLDVDGKLSGFIQREKSEQSIKPENVYGSSDFVHFMNNYRPNFEKMKIKVRKTEDEGNELSEESVVQEQNTKNTRPDHTTKASYQPSYDRHTQQASFKGMDDYVTKVVSSMYGTSILQNARKIYRIVNLLENAIAIARLARTPVVRVFYVNTIGMDKTERKETMSDLEEKFGMKKSFNLEKDIYKSKYHPLSYTDDVFLPTAGEKGDIRTEQLGGDVNIRDISDIEYYRNKLFAALRVPKAYLGFEETMPGGISAGSTLTRLDIRYGRMCKKVQRALIEGIYRMIQIHLSYKYNKEVDISKLSLMMVTVSTAEEDSQMEIEERKLGIASQMFGFVSELEGKIDTQYLLRYIFGEMLHLPGLDVAKLVNKEAQPLEASDRKPRNMKQFLEKIKRMDPDECSLADIMSLIREQANIFSKAEGPLSELPKNKDLKIPALTGRRIHATGRFENSKARKN